MIDLEELARAAFLGPVVCMVTCEGGTLRIEPRKVMRGLGYEGPREEQLLIPRIQLQVIVSTDITVLGLTSSLHVSRA